MESEKTCRNCIHYDACDNFFYDYEDNEVHSARNTKDTSISIAHTVVQKWTVGRVGRGGNR